MNQNMVPEDKILDNMALKVINSKYVIIILI